MKHEDGRPQLVAINHDDYHAEHVGRLADGRQFFLTTPFVPAIDNEEGEEFVALFLFDARGNVLDTKIDRFGPRGIMDETKRRQCYEDRLRQLGQPSFERIEVKPFEVEQFGTVFGLVVREPEDEDDVWAVELQPGNYMAFFEPFDSGDYDT